MIGLQGLPAVQVGGSSVVQEEAFAICSQHRVIHLETEKAEIVSFG